MYLNSLQKIEEYFPLTVAEVTVVIVLKPNTAACFSHIDQIYLI
jgi:hypothetical protein